MRTITLALTCLLSCTPAFAEEPLPDDFISARPAVQLFKAYAEFKMANYDLARRMWLNTKGGARGEALFNLGILYDEGLGVEADIARALNYYEEAARNGSRSAAYQLGMLYLHDPRIRTNTEQARHWLALAAYDGDSEAAAQLAALDSDSDTQTPLAKVRTLLIQGDTETALQQLHRLVKEGDTQALTQLAWLHEAGIGVDKNLKKAAILFEQAAKAGDADAQYALAVMLETGAGVEQNQIQSRYWLNQSAQQGHMGALRALSPESTPASENSQ